SRLRHLGAAVFLCLVRRSCPWRGRPARQTIATQGRLPARAGGVDAPRRVFAWSLAAWRSLILRMAHRRKVALLIETSNSYGRELLHGVRGWVRENGSWSIRLSEHGRGAGIPSWLRHW